MSANKYWYFFMCFLGLVTIWFAGKTFYELYSYAQLSATTTTTSIEWSVREINEERYLLDGKYTFTDSHGKSFAGESTLLSPFHLNAWAAEKAIEAIKGQQKEVWYSTSNPQYSSLQKNFPLKECLSLALLCGLLLYFVGLKHYVTKQNERHRPEK